MVAHAHENWDVCCCVCRACCGNTLYAGRPPKQSTAAALRTEEEMWLCQETGWGWLRKVGVSATAGQTRLRLRRGYEQPATKVSDWTSSNNFQDGRCFHLWQTLHWWCSRGDEESASKVRWGLAGWRSGWGFGGGRLCVGVRL